VNHTLTVAYPEPTWILLNFSSAILLTPSDDYFFELLSTSPFEWYYWDGSDDRYPCGLGKIDYSLFVPSGGDWTFITHYKIPPGHQVSLPYTTGVKALYWRYEINGENYPVEGSLDAINGTTIIPSNFNVCN